MRKAFLLACGGVLWAACLVAETANRDRVLQYFGGWYSICPNSKVTAGPASDIVVPGLESYRVTRECSAKNRDESSIALVDAAHDEVFVGQVLFDGQRRDRPFAPVSDLPTIRASLQETYGLPVALRVGKEPRGS